MLDFKLLEKILKEMEIKNLFNKFLNDLLDYKILDINNVIVRYKFDDCFIIDIFDYNNKNCKFIRYYFCEDNKKFEVKCEDVIVNVINIKVVYNEFNGLNKYYLFSSLFFEKDIDIIEKNLSKLFSNEINNIIIKHLKS